MKLVVLLFTIFIGIFSQEVNTDVDAFDKIELNVNAQVRVIISDKYHIEISGDDRELDRIHHEVHNDKLIIEHEGLRKGFMGWFRSNRNDYNEVKITIYTQSIEALEFSGAGNLMIRGLNENEFELSIKGPVDTEVDGTARDLLVKNYGPGDINFENLKSDNIELDVYGPGDVTMGGTSNYVNITIFGPGNVNAYDLEVKELKTKVVGPGDIKMTVTEKVSATIMGPGDVKIKGNPRDVSKSSFGPGEVKIY